MCPPLTLEILFPEPEPPPPPPPSSPGTTVPGGQDSSTTTTGGDTSTTTMPAETTTTLAPETTTTVSEPTTTSPGVGSSTTVPGSSTTQPPSQGDCVPFTYQMQWPLAGEGQAISGFGADRDGGARHHKGNDILAPRLTPVVAVADGEVMKVVQQVGTEECCWLSLRHDDGWQSYYIHLNNDRYGTDDGMGFGVRPDLVDGVKVRAGEVLGWVGDSGNAEDTVDHLHFELRTPEGEAVDPQPSLQAARSRAELADPQPNWPFADDDGLASEWLAASLLTEGLFLPCDETMITFCPDRLASPDLATVIVEHYTGSEPPGLSGRYQGLAASQGVTNLPTRQLEEAFGCVEVEECFAFGISEGDVARMAAWVRIHALVVTLLPKSATVEGAPTIHLPSADDAMTRLRAENLVSDCTMDLEDRALASRERTVTLLTSWLQGFDPAPCVDPDQRVR